MGGRSRLRAVLLGIILVGLAGVAQSRQEAPLATATPAPAEPAVTPTPAELAPTPTPEVSPWFPFRPMVDEFQPTVLDCSRFIEAPAGGHGSVRVNDEQFVFEDGTPARFWGAEIEVFPKTYMDYAAKRLRKLGVNAVRFRSLALLNDPQATSVLDLSADGMDQLDYAISRLIAEGVYVVLVLDEPASVRFSRADRVGALPQGGPAPLAAFFDPEVARLRLQRMRTLVMHRNTYTGRRYCDDPGVALVEVADDETLFSPEIDKLAPAFRVRLERAFQDWLRLRYRDDKGLARAWDVFGRSPLSRGEGLAAGQRIALMPASEFSVATLSHSPEKKKRGQDQMRFFNELEQRYWADCRSVLRQAGVKVPLAGSDGAAAGFTTRAHLLGQSQFDFVDRHGFWDLPAGAGDQAPRVASALFHNLPMVKETGASSRARRELGRGNLVLGKAWEQVLGKPFVIGGWNTCLPNEYSLEGPGLMAAYGLLQGWDAILELGYLNPRWLSQPSNSPFDLLGNPAQLLQYPAVATMFYRHDVKEGPLLAEMLYGTDEVFDWSDDRLPLAQEAGFVGKVGYRFTASPRAGALEQISGLWNEATRSARSVTGELIWNANDGLVTIETPRTQAMIGFLGGGERRLNSLMLASPTRFGAVWVTAMDGERSIAAAEHVLITVVGPARNTGMESAQTGQIAPDRDTSLWRVTQEGTSPLQLETVRGELRVRSQLAERLKAFALDYNGRRRGEVPVKATPGFVTLTLTPERHAVYYELALE